MRTGPSNLYEQAYAIKARTKSEDSFVRKVMDRQSVKSYSAFDATDVVGVRIVALFASDLPSLCQRLLDFLQFCQHETVQLIQGRSHSHAIEEVIVYKTHSSSSAYNDCYDLLLSIFGKNKVSLKNLTEGSDPRYYSSIHLVCSGRQYYQGRPRRIPIEFQLRAAYEDVWNEIQHKIQYKVATELNQTVKTEKQYSDSIALLNALKGNLDVATHVSEQIKDQLEKLQKVQPPGPWFSGSSRLLRRQIAHPDRGSIPGELQKNFDELQDEINVTFDTLADARSNNENMDSAIKALQLCNRNIVNFQRIYLECDRARFEGDVQTKYILDMDRALCLFWLSRLGQLGRRKKFSKKLEEAISIYNKLRSVDGFLSRSMLHFRLGHALLTGGKFEDAIHSLRTATDLLGDDGEMPVDDVYRIEIPKLLGFSYWLKLQSLRGMDAIEHLASACDATALCFRHFSSPEDIKNEDIRESGKLALHNYISYCTEAFALHDREIGEFLLGSLSIDIEEMLYVFGLRGSPGKNGSTASFRRIRQSLIVYDLMIGNMDDNQAIGELKNCAREIESDKRYSVRRERRRILEFIDGISTSSGS